MNLDYSIASIMDRLADWACFPKYQLERRVDIFLTPFVEAFVSSELKRHPVFASSEQDMKAVLVAPEFPILRDLRTAGPNAERESLSRRTANVDYLFYIAGSAPAWLFLELKTDCGSFDEEQADLYAIARQRGIRRLVEDLSHPAKKTGAKKKYAKLRNALPQLSGREEPILIGYLAPGKLQPEAEKLTYPSKGMPAPDALRGMKTIDRFFSLDALADQDLDSVPQEHRALWPYVRDLLRRIAPTASVDRAATRVRGAA